MSAFRRRFLFTLTSASQLTRFTIASRQFPQSFSHHAYSISTRSPAYHRNRSQREFKTLGLSAAASSVGLFIFLSSNDSIECSPTFGGVPVAAPFLLHQAVPYVTKQFPGLELPAVFVPNRGDEYTERVQWGITGMTRMCEVVVDVFEKLDEKEEAKLGASGLAKKPVGKCRMVGHCRFGCAEVHLVECSIEKLTGEVVWSWKKS